MLSESAKAKIEEAANKYEDKRYAGNTDLDHYGVSTSFIDGAQFGYALAIDEQVNTHPTVTRLKIELMKAQAEISALENKIKDGLSCCCSGCKKHNQDLKQSYEG
jgi:hypothetical protein